MNKNNELWELVNNLYKNSKNKKDFVKKCNDYWCGNLHTYYKVFSNQDKTAFNVVKPIIETKLKSVIDAQFTLSVIPKVMSFSSLNTIKNHQAVADVYNDELKNILNRNNIESKNEKVIRNGLNCGFSAFQTFWDDTDDERGEVKINFLSSENLFWDKDATSIDDTLYIGYSFQINPSKAKDLYARNEDGTYDIEKCKLIDNISTDKTKEDRKYSNNKGVVNYSTDNGNSGGQLYAKDVRDGICAGKIVNLICIYIVDDSLYSPEKEDDTDDESFKKESIAKYPNGRMIIFSDNDREKLILEDKALPKSFRNLANIDIFNPIKWDSIEGKGEVEDLFEIQNRIDGLYNKYRNSLNNDLSAIVMEKNEEISMDDLVNNPIIYINHKSLPPTSVSNNGIQLASNVLEMINQLEIQAQKISRVNETMLYGARQTGTTSANQIEALQENPLADIRSIQRNFKDFLISVGNKILALIKNNYNVDRLIKLSSGINKETFAKLQLNPIDGSKEMVMLDSLGQAINTIKISDEWDFEVEVSAGTSVPRSRKEQANLMRSLISDGILDIKDVDVIEQYLKSIDMPNYRVIIDIIKSKQKDFQKYQQSPESRSWIEMMKNPTIAKEFSNVFKSLSGYPIAQQQMLKEIGLISDPANLENSPITEITRESDVAEVISIVPNKISNDPQKQVEGYNAAVAEQLTDI